MWLLKNDVRDRMGACKGFKNSVKNEMLRIIWIYFSMC